MYEGSVLIILSNVPYKESINSTVDINESPKLVEHRLIEGNAKNDLLEHILRLSSDH